MMMIQTCLIFSWPTFQTPLLLHFLLFFYHFHLCLSFFSYLRLSIDALLFLWKTTTNYVKIYPRNTHTHTHTGVSCVWFLLILFTSQLKTRDTLSNFLSTNIILHLCVFFVTLTRMYLCGTLLVCLLIYLWSFHSAAVFMRTWTIYVLLTRAYAALKTMLSLPFVQ